MKSWKRASRAAVLLLLGTLAVVVTQASTQIGWHTSAYAQTSVALIGQVVEADGVTPVVGATLTLLNGNASTEATTDSNGQFTLLGDAGTNETLQLDANTPIVVHVSGTISLISNWHYVLSGSLPGGGTIGAIGDVAIPTPTNPFVIPVQAPGVIPEAPMPVLLIVAGMPPALVAARILRRNRRKASQVA